MRREEEETITAGRAPPAGLSQKIICFNEALKKWNREFEKPNQRVFRDTSDLNSNIFMRTFEFELDSVLPPQPPRNSNFFEMSTATNIKRGRSSRQPQNPYSGRRSVRNSHGCEYFAPPGSAASSSSRSNLEEQTQTTAVSDSENYATDVAATEDTACCWQQQFELAHYERHCLDFLNKAMASADEKTRTLLNRHICTPDLLNNFFCKFLQSLHLEIIKNEAHAVTPSIKKNIFKVPIGNFYHIRKKICLDCEELGATLNFSLCP
jgi:hypothetical protein